MNIKEYKKRLKEEYDKKYNEELKKTGLFWGFDREQFDKNKTHKEAEDEEYYRVFGGGYIHESNYKKLIYFFKIIEPNLKEEYNRKLKEGMK